MNINNGSLGYTLTLNNKQFNDLLRQSQQKINNFSASSIREINNINLSVKDLAAGIGIAFGVNEAKNFIQQMVKVRGEFQQTEIAFNTMLQSQDKSKKLMAEMVELAKNTPMQFSEVSQGAKQLLAYQVEAENLTETLTMLGNISSGLSVPLSRLILVYGQVRAKGKLMGDDLRQFTEAGVPMIAEIAKNMGIAQSEVANMVSEGKVGFKEVEQVLKNLTSQGGLFFNMMEEQSKTIPGQIAKLQDELEQMFNTLGKEAEPVITSIISGTASLVENYDKLLRVLAVLIASYGTYKTAVVVASVAQNSHAIATTLASNAWKVLNTTMGKNPIAMILTLVAGLVASLVDLEDILGKANIEFAGVSAEMETNTLYTKELSKAVAETKSKIDPLIGVIKDETSSLNVRKRAYDDLIKIHPEFKDTLDNEYKATVKLDGAYKDLIKRLDEAALARARETVRQQRAERLANAEAIEYDAKLRADAEIKANEKISKDNEKRAKKYADDLRSSTRESVEMSYTPGSTSTAAQKAYEDAKNNVSLAKKELDDFSNYSKKWYKDLEVNNESSGGGGNNNGNSDAKSKSTKNTDPLEIFKKEVEQYKEQYDKIQKYSDTTDIGLTLESNRLKLVLKGKGETYLDFLKQQQKQLMESAKTSEFAAKQLAVINAEIYPLLNDSLIEAYKKDFEKQLELSDTLIEKVELIKKAKAELEDNTDENSKIKFQFISEKELQNQANIDTYLKDANRKFDEQYQFLTTMRKEYDADMLLLQEQYNKASNDAEKKRIQELMVLRLGQYNTDTNGKTENVEVNQILEDFKTLEQKKLDISQSYADKAALIRSQINNETSIEDLKRFTDTISEIERKQTEALNAVDKEILEKSEGWIALFADYSNKSSKEISKIINDSEVSLNTPEIASKLNADEIKAIQDRITALRNDLSKNDPFTSLSNSFKKMITDFKNGKKFDFENLKRSVADVKNVVNESVSMAEGLGISVSDSTKSALQLGTELFEAGSNIAQGIAAKDPIQVVKGVVQGITSIINAGDRKKERQIQKYKAAVDELSKSFNQLQIATDKALGRDVYKNQQQMINNLNQQNAEIDKMIQKEKDKKKTDNNKIKEWEQQKIDNLNRSKEIMESITQDILQTNAKDLASTLGDALVEAFGRGEDAALSFEKVANDVLKNAVLNQLKKSFLEKDLQPILDNLQSQMGVTENGWNGLSKAQQDQFRSEIERVSKNFNGALGSYADLFKDLGAAVEEEEKGLSGAFKGMSEEAANLLSGQMNAIRINMSQILEIYSNSNAILVQQLDQLFRIEFNTRNIVPELVQIKNALNNNSRAFGL